MNFRDVLSEFFASMFNDTLFSIGDINFDFTDLCLVALFITLVIVFVFILLLFFES